MQGDATKPVPLSVLFLLFISFQVQISAAAIVSSCNYTVSGSNNTYLFQNSCPAQQISFAQSASDNKLVCGRATAAVTQVLFQSGTYNNSIINCTFADANIFNAYKAQNNLLSPFGTYNLSFSDNTSNIAVGYYFTFVPRDVNGDVTFQAFGDVNPFYLVDKSQQVMISQWLTREQIDAVMGRLNYTPPRFGTYTPVRFSYNVTFALEAYQVSKNGTRSFNPYWFMSPDWGLDILSYLKFNITSNRVYTPFFIKPDSGSNFQLPDNSSPYWNFTTRNYSGATNVTAIISPTYQSEPLKPAVTIRNYTGTHISYRFPPQKPGIYQVLGQLRAIYDGQFEMANSTTSNFGVGLAFCTSAGPPLSVPGRYSMAFNALTELNTFWPSGDTCANAVTIASSNVTIDCRGGAINSTRSTVTVLNSGGVVVENCRLSGNSIVSQNSVLKIYNSTLTANGPKDAAFSGSGSAIELFNTSVNGYSTYSSMQNSTITVLQQYEPPASTGPQQQASNSSAAAQRIPGVYVIRLDKYYLQILALLAALFWAGYYLFSRRVKAKRPGNKGKTQKRR